MPAPPQSLPTAEAEGDLVSCIAFPLLPFVASLAQLTEISESSLPRGLPESFSVYPSGDPTDLTVEKKRVSFRRQK